MPRFFAMLLAIASFTAALVRADDPANSGDGAGAAAIAFMQALQKKDLEAAKRLVAKSGAEAFEEMVAFHKEEPDNLPKGVPTVVNVQGDATRTIVTLSFGGEGKVFARFRLIKEDQSWKIDLQEMKRGDVDEMRGNLEEARRGRAKLDIEGLQTQLQMYEIFNGTLPSTQQGLQALVQKPAGDPEPRRWSKLMIEVPLDGWGTPYQYLFPAKRSKKDSYDLFSAGPDKQPGTADDIGNW